MPAQAEDVEDEVDDFFKKKQLSKETGLSIRAGSRPKPPAS